MTKIHSCVDAVVLAGAIPGAGIYIHDGQSDVGSTAAKATKVSVPIFAIQALPSGTVLKARQEANGEQSSPTPSLRADAAPVLERTLQTPAILPPMYECDTAVTVVGLLDGTTLRLESDQGGGGDYLFFGNSMSAHTPPLKVGEKLWANQYFRYCGDESSWSPPVQVEPLAELPPPRVLEPLCRGAKQFTVVDLVRGATITVYAGRDGNLGFLIGQATAMATELTWPMPPLPTSDGHPPDYLTVSQSRCNAGNKTALTTNFYAFPGSAATSYLPAMVECARVVEVGNLTPSATLFLTSNYPGWPVLSPPIQVTQPRMPGSCTVL